MTQATAKQVWQTLAKAPTDVRQMATGLSEAFGKPRGSLRLFRDRGVPRSPIKLLGLSLEQFTLPDTQRAQDLLCDPKS